MRRRTHRRQPLRSFAVIGVVVALTPVTAEAAQASTGARVGRPAAVGALAPAGAPVTFNGAGLQPLVPARILDTRDGTGARPGPVNATESIDLRVTGVGGVPTTGVGAVVINLTAITATAPSYVTAWPTGAPRPLASNLNVDAGTTIPNLVIVKVGTGGNISLYNNNGQLHLAADVVGWFPEGAGLQPLVPARVLDTRIGTGVRQGRVSATEMIELRVTGVGGVPASGVGAVVLNLTAINATAPSYVTAWPGGTTRPLASNLNVVAGSTIPNLVIVKVGLDGTIGLYNNNGELDLAADVVGWFPDGAGLQPLVPARILDTRDGTGARPGPVNATESIDLRVTGVGGVPTTGVGAVVINLTAITATAPSYVTAWPTGAPRPLASNLNVDAGTTIPNLVIVKVGTGGNISLYNNNGQLHLAADVVGWFPTGAESSTTLTPRLGTVLVGAGDVLSVSGNSATGGSVLLAASADAPAAGAHLAVLPHPLVPEGMIGLVTASVRSADGSTLITLAPAVIEEAFADLDTSFSGAVAPVRAERAQLRTAALSCEANAGPQVSPTIELAGVTLEFHHNLLQRQFHLDLNATATFGMSASITGSLGCSFSFPELTIPVPFATIDLVPTISITISSSVTLSASFSAPLRFGFDVNGDNVVNLSSFTPSATGSIDAELETSVTIRPSLKADVKLFGLAGGYVDLGVDFTGSIAPLGVPCAEIAMQFSIDFGFEVGRWGVAWDVQLASLSGPKKTLYEKVEGCPGSEVSWVGSVSVSQTMPEAVLPVYGDGQLILTYHEQRSYSHHFQSTTSSLLNRVYGDNAPADVVGSLDSLDAFSQTDYPDVEDGPCNTLRSTPTGGPFSLSSNLTDDPVSGEPLLNPVPFQTAYILFDPGLGTQTACADGTLVVAPAAVGLYAIGKRYGIEDCHAQYIYARGHCYLPVQISADGNHIDADVTASGPFRVVVYDAQTTVTVTQTVHIHLTRKPLRTG